jgi:queuine/archaeosine tRNA-ribosyltransferase
MQKAPIHVFGCFDPQTIVHLFFAGADVFDGLAWMRYYFHNGHSFYDKEFEYNAPPEQLLEPWDAAENLLRHNVEELERLRTDLRYTVLTKDVSQFEECLTSLKIFESTILLEHSAAHRQR